MNPVILHLPFPPTVNTYWVRTKAGIKVSAKGKKYGRECIECVKEQRAGIYNINYRMAVTIILHPPDRRQRDIDNYHKALLDSITASGLWKDDSLIDQLFTYRGSIISKGKAIVAIQEASLVIPQGYEHIAIEN